MTPASLLLFFSSKCKILTDNDLDILVDASIQVGFSTIYILHRMI